MTYTPAIPAEIKTQRNMVVSTWDRTSDVAASAFVSAAWPLANLALYVPIYFNQACTIYYVGTATGATAGGNFDIGLYQMDGTKLQSTGTQARTASAWNGVDWADLDVQPGWYYAAMSADGTNNYSAVASAAGLCEAVGVVEQTSAFTLPSPATISTRTTRAYMPNIAFVTRSVALA